MHEEDEKYDDWFLKHCQNGGVNGYAKNGIVNTVNMESPRTKVYYLDKDIRTWSDFKKIHYHPKSTVTFNRQFNGSVNFDSWIAGVNHFKTGDIFNHLEEAIRFYAEECDTIQGFQVLSDLNNGFGGISCMLMEYLQDEFVGKSFAVMPVLQTDNDRGLSKSRDTSLSSLLTLSGLLDTSSMMCPLSMSADMFSCKPRSFPQLIYNASAPYHTSAILASCLDNASRPYRLKSGNQSLVQLMDSMVSGSRKLVSMSAALPLPFDLGNHETLLDFLLEYSTVDPWIPVTPNIDNSISDSERCYSQAFSLSGLDADLIVPSSASKRIGHFEFKNPNEIIDKYLSERFPSAINKISVFSTPLSTAAPFPHIFSNAVLKNGFIKSHSEKFSSAFSSAPPGIKPALFLSQSPIKETSKKDKLAVDVRHVPILTNMQTWSGSRRLLQRCHERASALKRWVVQNRHSDAAVEQEALEEALERFETLKQDYSHLTIHDLSDDSD